MFSISFKIIKIIKEVKAISNEIAKTKVANTF